MMLNSNLIGNKIAEARKKINLSQAELAQQVAISPQAVGKWERGESLPDITKLVTLAEILGVSLNYFIKDLENEADEPSAKNKTKEEEVIESKAQSSDKGLKLNLTASDLQKSDFANVVLHKGKFKATQFKEANFEGADLSGTSFEVCDMRGVNFNTTNLKDCNFSICDLTDANFHKSIFAGTVFNMSGQTAKFKEANLLDVKFSKSDLRDTSFDKCSFKGVEFDHCDLRGKNFEGQSFEDVRFFKSSLNDVSFIGATFKNVSITVPFSVTNKSYKALSSICFDGANMDKLTYAVLKGLRTVDLSKVNVY